MRLFILFLLFVLLSLTLAEKSTADLNNELYQAVRADSIIEIQRILDAGAEINTRSGPGEQTPLMNAVLTGKENAVSVLLESGASTTIGEKDGYKPMDGAAYQGRAAIVRKLYEHGVPLDQVHPRDGNRPVQRSCWGRQDRHSETVATFLELGAKLTAGECQTTNKNTWDVLRKFGLLRNNMKQNDL
uniref:Ankyrin repeat protein n=1 Tax=Aureoumbra lagunensis TaxID=44058 RepID=A0A7S3NM35_9STRA|mmetsp:Transcript_9627/g.13343  ORF Transcript_9627/g.13343 Transcript_9627/m.13343 type:complete len:187 (-) Transcript_9627:239-799(-)